MTQQTPLQMAREFLEQAQARYTETLAEIDALDGAPPAWIVRNPRGNVCIRYDDSAKGGVRSSTALKATRFIQERTAALTAAQTFNGAGEPAAAVLLVTALNDSAEDTINVMRLLEERIRELSAAAQPAQ